MAQQIKKSGKEDAPTESYIGTEAPTGLVSRIGTYNTFTTTGSTGVKNIAWGGNTVTGTLKDNNGAAVSAVAYEGRNILIHWIRAINEDSAIKKISFWSNNDTTRTAHTGVANYLFSISLGGRGGVGSSGSAKQDAVIDFPIPLLVMGGCRVGIAGSGNMDAEVTICYTVLDSTPTTAPFETLKYKYLSAFETESTATNGVSVVEPDSGSVMWKEDIELWGGMVFNKINAGGSPITAKSEVYNSMNEVCATMQVIKGAVSSLGPFNNIPADFSLSFPTYTVPLVGQVPYNVLFTWTLKDDVYFSFFESGSDQEISFFRHPIWVKGYSGPTGTAAGGSGDLAVTTQADSFKIKCSANTAATWFYRPVKSQGLSYGWV